MLESFNITYHQGNQGHRGRVAVGIDDTIHLFLEGDAAPVILDFQALWLATRALFLAAGRTAPKPENGADDGDRVTPEAPPRWSNAVHGDPGKWDREGLV